MYNACIITFVVLFLVFTIPAVDSINFSGEWLFDKSKSEYSEGGDRFIPIKLKIVQSDTLLLIERTYQREFDGDFVDTLKFTLDGAENYSEFWNSPRIIRASWTENKDALVIKTKITFSRDGQESEMLSTDIWRLKQDGTEISRDFTINGPWGEFNAIYVFCKM